MEDDQIIDLFWKRSEQAINEVTAKYGQYCRSIAIHILNNREDAKECENDTYVAAWNTIPPARPNNLKIFLGRITRNIASDKYDYNTAKKRNHEFDLILSELEECLPSSANVESQYEKRELSDALNSFLRSIDQDSRMVFVRRYWYSDSVRTISTRFSMSESKVKSMLFRTRNKLKKHLEEEGFLL